MPSLFPYTPEQNCKVNSGDVAAFFFLGKMQLDLHITSLNVWGMALWGSYKSLHILREYTSF